MTKGNLMIKCPNWTRSLTSPMQEKYFLIFLRKNFIPYPNLATSSNLACKQEIQLSIFKSSHSFKPGMQARNGVKHQWLYFWSFRLQAGFGWDFVIYLVYFNLAEHYKCPQLLKAIILLNLPEEKIEMGCWTGRT